MGYPRYENCVKNEEVGVRPLINCVKNEGVGGVLQV